MERDIQQLEAKAWEIRELVLDTCVRAKTGHVTSSFSSAEIMVALYHGHVLRYDAKRPQWEGRDRFILSKGQASPLLYAVLADIGFFPKDELKRFCAKDGIFGVHLQHDVKGVEITSGSLGQGLGIAAGMALAARMDKKKHRVITLLGDGECYEGSVWESAMFASHHKLDNLTALIDRNWLCVTGPTEEIVKLDPLEEKWKAYGWDTVTIDGHSVSELLKTLDHALTVKRQRPFMIIAQTVKGKGVSFMEHQHLWHGISPQGEHAVTARQELKKKRGR
jgi:transketolase